jgi:hypothetical protein
LDASNGLDQHPDDERAVSPRTHGLVALRAFAIGYGGVGPPRPVTRRLLARTDWGCLGQRRAHCKATRHGLPSPEQLTAAGPIRFDGRC